MFYNNLITVGETDGKYLSIIPRMANRHGLIAGATGTGKTVTLKVMAESFSDAGVPVFLADVKGDIAGMCASGCESEDMNERIRRFNLSDKGFSFKSYPTRFWDIYAERGLPVRTTISEFGPLLLARLLELNQIQSDILNIVFKIADDAGLLLIDIKDLKASLNYAADHAKDYKAEYGNIAASSVAAIMRRIVALENRGADRLFGEPALDIEDLFVTGASGRGMINILDSEALITDPLVYSTFLLWMLSELFEKLPEVGDQEKPKMVFFFDEAHLVFEDAPKALLTIIEKVVKLIRSKGVGVYFVTQNPRDIPDSVLAQLGNKVQHALHSYTPAEQRGLRAAADSFRVNPKFDTETVLQQLGTGEALVSFLQEDGTPAVVERAFILPPQSKMGTIDDGSRNQIISSDFLKSKYNEETDRDSAYEFIQRLQLEYEEQKEAEAEELAAKKQQAMEEKAAAKEAAKAEKQAEKESEAKKKNLKSQASKVAQSAVGTVGREIGNTIGNSVGGVLGKKIGGNVGAQLGRGIMQTLFKLK